MATSSAERKVVLITGASSGIGEATAVEFAKKGYCLALCGRNEEALNNAAAKCLAENAELKTEDVLVIRGDLSKEEDCKAAVDKTIERFKRIDVLVTSAGILAAGSIETITLEDYDRVMNINARSVLHMIQLAIPHLEKVKGNIVNVSSVTGMRAFPGVLGYCMSKAALDQLTRCAALELAPKGIRVNAVNPGVITTGIHKRAGMSEEAYEKFLEHSRTTHALGRAGTAEEVAKSIVFLASDDGSFITGVTLAIDGGRSIMCPR